MKDITQNNPGKFRSHQFHKFWLKITAVVVGSFAPVFFLGTMESSIEPARLTLDMLSWPIDGATTYQSSDTRFLSALTGGFLLGWGVTIWLLSVWVYDLAPEGIRKTVLFWGSFLVFSGQLGLYRIRKPIQCGYQYFCVASCGRPIVATCHKMIKPGAIC